MGSGGKLYKIGTLSREAGVSPILLRAWEKRYRLFRPQRGPGNQRLYTGEDLKLLQLLVRETGSGVRIGELAAHGREQLLALAGKKNARAVENTGDTATAQDVLLHAGFTATLVQTARRLDTQGLQAALSRAAMELPPDALVFQVLVPAMQQAGEAYLAGRMHIAGEHLLSGSLEQWLREAIRQAGANAGTSSEPRALCACFPGEEHRIGLLATAYRLARSGHRVIILGAAVPLQSLEESMAAIHPASVWLSVTSPARYRKNRQDLLALVSRRQIPLTIGGQGVQRRDPMLESATVRLWSSRSLPPAEWFRLSP